MLSPLLSTKTTTGIGYTQNEDSFQAGVDIATQAVKNTGLSTETLFLLFATPHHDIQRLMDGIRSVISDQPRFLGCTTTGLVTHDYISYNGVLAGGMFLSSDQPFFRLFLERDIRNREEEAGKNIARKLQQAAIQQDSSLLLFYDSIKVTATEGQPMLNVATPLLEGFYTQYRYWPTVAGVGAWGDINVAYPCAVWADAQISRHGLAVAAIGGSLQMDTIIMHGTRPIGGYHTITKAEGSTIYEIDDKPALDVIDRILGGSVPWEEFPLLVTLGVNNGDKFGEFNEDDYASRLCFAIDREQKALIMFENDLVTGSEVQLMRRNIDFTYIQPQVDKLLAKAGNHKPVAALYIDCLGRVSGFSGLPQEESLEVIKALGDIPFFGIFSGVEIANVGPCVRALDWTGVLCLFSEA